MTPTLYHYVLSPFCRKVRLVLAEKRVEVALIDERYWDPSADFLRRSPAGKVPVLDLDGVTLTESQAICEYLDETRDGPVLMPADPLGRYEVRRLCSWFDDKFYHDATKPLVGERLNRKLMGGGAPDSRAILAGAKAMKRHLDYMHGLLDRRRWLAGDVMTLADFTAAAHLSCIDYVSDVDWRHSDEVKTWYAKIKSRPAFQTILRDQIPSNPQPRHYADLDF